ncbi:MAG: quinoprotein dehydrogenase-associated SoxYZ-like carrier [Ahrensia sp.]|nr:quinoprotein dehydrogenase-associated SoxYZ-like carrier [Ahrensia sp.]
MKLRLGRLGLGKLGFALALQGVVALGTATSALAVDDTKVKLDDPLKTGMFAYHQKLILGDPDKITFDERVIVRAPVSAEDSLNVPVTVDATAIADVRRIVLFVDYGPIPKILTYWPQRAQPKLSFRFKIDQATPVRAAVETTSGAWHVGHTIIDAAGGGCTAPAVAYASDDWEEELGKVYASVWPDRGRVRMVVDHPMDTGLAGDIPMFIIQKLQLDDLDGTKLAQIDLHEPVNEDPAFTLYFEKGALKDKLRIHGRDNNGNPIDAIASAQVTQ